MLPIFFPTLWMAETKSCRIDPESTFLVTSGREGGREREREPLPHMCYCCVCPSTLFLWPSPQGRWREKGMKAKWGGGGGGGGHCCKCSFFFRGWTEVGNLGVLQRDEKERKGEVSVSAAGQLSLPPTLMGWTDKGKKTDEGKKKAGHNWRSTKGGRWRGEEENFLPIVKKKDHSNN